MMCPSARSTTMTFPSSTKPLWNSATRGVSSRAARCLKRNSRDNRGRKTLLKKGCSSPGTPPFPRLSTDGEAARRLSRRNEKAHSCICGMGLFLWLHVRRDICGRGWSVFTLRMFFRLCEAGGRCEGISTLCLRCSMPEQTYLKF